MTATVFPGLTRTRPVVAGRNGAVATAHPLATLAGFDLLRRGGNAIDAVVGAAAALGVVEPYMSGLGGVGFLLWHPVGGPTQVLNFGGHAPARATPDQFTYATREHGIRASLVPGNVAGWFEMLRKQGTLPAADVLAPAICLAESGFPLHPFNVEMIRSSIPRLNAAGQSIYGNLTLRIGAILKQPEMGGTLRGIASQGPDYFYRGPFAERLHQFMEAEGGLMTRDDLAAFQPEWQEPIEVSYRGLRVKTCPPNNEGFQILQTLKILEGLDLKRLGHNSTEYIHQVSEAVKLAVADRIRWAGDPRFQSVPLERLLSDPYAEQQRKRMNPLRASHSEGERWPGEPTPSVVAPGQIEGLTTHLSAVDAQGNVASITQSLGNGFGSGMVVPGTGVALNSFAYWFEIDPACPTPNLIAPGKRWAACMAPVQVFQDDGRRFWFSIATPGSYGILHTTLQMLLNIVEFGADCQAAIEAPRFRLWEGTRMQIESRVPTAVLTDLCRRGHLLELLGDFDYRVGGGQSVMIDAEGGARLAGADPRRDGYAMAY
ncbi:MAG: gamma-glutamyltransferase [Planctomycetales bacterium]